MQDHKRNQFRNQKPKKLSSRNYSVARVYRLGLQSTLGDMYRRFGGSYTFDFQGKIYLIPSTLMHNLCPQISAKQKMYFTAVVSPCTILNAQQWIPEPRHWLILSLRRNCTLTAWWLEFNIKQSNNLKKDELYSTVIGCSWRTVQHKVSLVRSLFVNITWILAIWYSYSRMTISLFCVRSLYILRHYFATSSTDRGKCYTQYVAQYIAR